MATLRSDLSKVARQISEAAGEALMQTAQDVYQISQQLVPVDSGDLKASGSTDITKIENGIATRVVVGYGNEEVDYARYVEYGTSNPNYPAQPFLTPAFTQAEDIMRVRLREAINKAIGG